MAATTVNTNDRLMFALLVALMLGNVVAAALGAVAWDVVIEDDSTGNKGIFSSIISKIENIYDDCS